jgi:hypothetical protein
VVGPLLLLVAAVGTLRDTRLAPAVGALSAVVGAVLTVTGLTRRCPLNSLLGVDTASEPTPTEAATQIEIERLAD